MALPTSLPMLGIGSRTILVQGKGLGQTLTDLVATTTRTLESPQMEGQTRPPGQGKVVEVGSLTTTILLQTEELRTTRMGRLKGLALVQKAIRL